MAVYHLPMLDHQFVYIVVEAVLDRSAQLASPHRPLPIARTPISKRRYPNTVRILGISAVEVLYLHRVRL